MPEPEAGVIDGPIARGEGLRRVVAPHGRPARTHYQTLAKGQGLGLIRFRLETGRTHQIRAHMAHLGCPLVGDWLYGCEDPRLPGRFALHCFRLRLVHPVTGRTLTFAAPPPPEMRPLMAGLRPTRPL